MRPMSLLETGHSTGAVCLGGLLEGTGPRSPDPGLGVAEIAELVAVGGWPGNLGLETSTTPAAVRDYLDEIRRADISRVDGTERDPERVGRLMRSLARNVSTHAAATTLAARYGRCERPRPRRDGRDYLVALSRLMILEDQRAWAPHLRSRSVLRKAAKRHFVDPSLAVAALRATPERLLFDLELLGLLFESLVVRDLRVYARPVDARLFQYRDNNGLEVDAVVEAADGRWAAFEVKLGQRQVEEATGVLHRLVERVDTRRIGEPATLGVFVGTGYGYVREDGIAVIPIGALGP